MAAHLYNGNHLFHDKPSYTIFNGCFCDSPTTDALFLLLNEIDAGQLRNNDSDGLNNDVLVDPRTKLEVQQTKYDYTSDRSVRVFHSLIPSTITRGQHIACLRVLKAWQERKPVEETDILVWRLTEPKRHKEQQQMQEHIANYCQAHREEMYAPSKRLNALYKSWYTKTTKQLLQQRALDVAYNTHTGLPHVNVCKGGGGSTDTQQAIIGNVRLVQRTGWLPLWKQNTQINYRHMQFKLERHFHLFNEGTLPDLQPLDDRSLESDETHKIILPLESLLFLLTAGDYIDLPTEMPMMISDNTEHENKQLTFELPLPARHCGWHTDKLVVEQAYAGYISIADQVQWLQVTDESVHIAQSCNVAELHAVVKEDSHDYLVQTIDEFVQRASNSYKSHEREVRLNSALINWQLQKEEPQQEQESLRFDVYTTTSLPGALDENATRFAATHCIKLEYKPQFGCEVMTKYELLREWWRLRLLSGCTNIVEGRCTRISISNFELQMEEQINLAQIEQRLCELYHVRVSQLLSNLMEFLRLLLNMPTGHYLLRYNPKFRDKLMLCAPTHEITQNTVFLHSMLNTQPSDLAFMTQPHRLPIAEDLCSRVHTCHNVLPAMFLPTRWDRRRQITPPKAKSLAAKGKLINDRDHVLRRVQMMQETRKATQDALKKRQKREQRARKRKRVKKLKQQHEISQASEEQQLQREIAEDQKFFMF